MGHERVLAEEIYRKYKKFNDGFVPNGACIHIAYEVYKSTGAMPVAGYLHMCTIKRSH